MSNFKKIRYKLISLLLCAIIGATGVVSVFGEIGTEAKTSLRVENLLKGMTLQEKICQMLMIDFRNWNGSSFTVMNDEVRKIVEDYNFGAVVYFAPNMAGTQQVYTLTREMQVAATNGGDIPMIITADQEGGIIYRLATGTALPGNMALGATHNPVYAKMSGNIIGSEFYSLGLNSTLAPVVDVNNNANNSVIGLRSYGDDAAKVGEMAAANIQGLCEEGVVGCAKHFPGHGDTSTDSHYGLPIVNKSLAQVQECELKPYEIAISKGIDMIMTAHILYPQLEGDKVISTKTGNAESLPATLSDDIVTGLLKEKMGFEGVVVTDAMNMGALANYWYISQSAVLAINAGVDMLCMPCTVHSQSQLSNLTNVISVIETAVNKGTISMSRIDDAVTRILTVKEKNGILDWESGQTTLADANATVGSDFNHQVEREIAAASITVVKNNNNTLPLNLSSDSKVLMMVPYNNERAQMVMGWNRAKAAGIIPDGAQMQVMTFSNANIRNYQQTIDQYDTIIINSEICSASLISNNSYLYAGPKAFSDYAAGKGKKVVIMSVDKPYDLQFYPNASAVIATYGCMGSSLDPTESMNNDITTSDEAYGPNIIAGVEVALGVFGAGGKLPVDIPTYSNGEYLSTLVYKNGYGLTYNAKHTHSVSKISDLENYKREFYQCDGCGVWFEDADANVVIRDKFSILGKAEGEDTSNAESSLPESSQIVAAKYGDVNMGGGVTSSDALMALQFSVKKIVLNQEQIVIADVDGQEGVSSSDALMILQKSVGKIDKFPVEK